MTSQKKKFTCQIIVPGINFNVMFSIIYRGKGTLVLILFIESEKFCFLNLSRSTVTRSCPFLTCLHRYLASLKKI